MSQTDNWKSEFSFCSRRMRMGLFDYHYVDEGAGRPILMVHGNPTWSFYWRHLISQFCDTHRPIAVDHIGCGLSDKPQNYDYSLATHVRNLVELIERLDLNDITLVGHDWGGAIGLGAAVQLPDRFSRFVMFNTAAFPPPFFPWRIRVCRTPLLGQVALRGMNLFSLAALQMAVERPAELSDKFVDGILAPYDSWANRVAVHHFVKDIPESPDHPTWRVLEQIESGVKQFANHPFSLMWGMKDWCFRPACLDRFVELLPNAEVHKFDNVGHWIVEEAKTEVGRLFTDFMARTDEVTAQGEVAPIASPAS